MPSLGLPPQLLAWTEARAEKLMVALASAAVGAALVSTVLATSADPWRSPPPSLAASARGGLAPSPPPTPVASAPAPTRVSAVVPAHLAPTPPAAAVVAVPEERPTAAIQAAAPAAAKPARERAHRRTAHAKKKAKRAERHRRHAVRERPQQKPAARVAQGPSPVAALLARARTPYLAGDLQATMGILGGGGPAAAASSERVARIQRLLADGRGELRSHDEAAATRSFEQAATLDRETGFGQGEVGREIGRQLGLLHVASALRARRAGNDALARREFQAAQRADPGNARARIELSSQWVNDSIAP